MAYVTVAEARAEGIPATIPDNKISESILMWSEFMDRACRQFFESRSATVDIDGNDSDILFLPVPIIAITSLFINNDFVTALPAANYKVYNRRDDPEDDRKNPRVKLLHTDSVFDPPMFPIHPVFAKGKQNQRIVGTFGFTESDGSTPLLIKRAIKKLIMRDLIAQGATNPGLWFAAQGGGLPPGVKTFEMTDGHSVSYASPVKTATRLGLSGVTGDFEVDGIITLYRAPISLAVPSSIRFFQS